MSTSLSRPLPPASPLTIRDLLSGAGVSARSFIGPALLSASGAVCEGLGGVLLVPALEAALSGRLDRLTDSSAVNALAALIPAASLAGEKTVLVAVLGLIAASALLKTLLMNRAAVSSAHLVHRVTGALRLRILAACLAADKRLFDKQNRSRAQNLMQTQIYRLSSQALTAHEAVSHFFLLAAYSALMVYISWRLAALVVCLLPLLHFASNAMTSKLRTASRDGTLAQRLLASRLAGAVDNADRVRAEGAAHVELRHVAALADRSDALQAEQDIRSGLMPRVQESVFLLMIVILLAALLFFASEGPAAAAPAMLVFVYAARRATICALSVARLAAVTAAVSGALSDAADFLAGADGCKDPDGAAPFPGLKESLAVEGLSFDYPEGRRALRSISFKVAKGETLAIVGPSGSGKSTLLNIIVRAYAPPPGSVRVDGTDVRDFTAGSWASAVAWVPQDPGFFDDTIRANLCYPAESHEVSPERLRKSLSEAGLLDFVDALPEGLDTRIGEGGVRLSGGERQRLALARAFLKGGEILLFDEATSALDSESEVIVRHSLQTAAQGKTSLVVAHRLSTIRHADRILVLDEGRAVQTGTFESLRGVDGVFRRLLDAQTFR